MTNANEKCMYEMTNACMKKKLFKIKNTSLKNLTLNNDSDQETKNFVHMQKLLQIYMTAVPYVLPVSTVKNSQLAEENWETKELEKFW